MPLKMFREKTKQKLHLDPKFKAAASPRVEQMYKELSDYALRLKTCEKQIMTLKKATMGMLNVTEEALTSPLPKVYTTHTQTGKLLVEETQDLHSADDAVQITQLGRLSETTGRRLDEEVLLPMDKWSNNFADVKKRKAQLEQFRIKYDAEKRALAKLESHKLKIEQNGGQLENKDLRKYESKAVKYHAAEQAWVEYEQTTADSLTRLVQEAKLIRMHLTRAMQVEGQMFQEAVSLPAVQEAVHTSQEEPVMPEAQPVSTPVTPEASHNKSYSVINKPATPDHIHTAAPTGESTPGSTEHIKIPPTFEPTSAADDDLPTPPTSHYPAVPTMTEKPPAAKAMAY